MEQTAPEAQFRTWRMQDLHQNDIKPTSINPGQMMRVQDQMKRGSYQDKDEGKGQGNEDGEGREDKDKERGDEDKGDEDEGGEVKDEDEDVAQNNPPRFDEDEEPALKIEQSRERVLSSSHLGDGMTLPGPKTVQEDDRRRSVNF